MEASNQVSHLARPFRAARGAGAWPTRWTGNEALTSIEEGDAFSQAPKGSTRARKRAPPVWAVWGRPVPSTGARGDAKTPPCCWGFERCGDTGRDGTGSRLRRILFGQSCPSGRSPPTNEPRNKELDNDHQQTDAPRTSTRHG
jgi:hypothetical protein